MDLEIFKAVMTVVGPLLGVGAGSLLSWKATTAAEERKAKREDVLAVEREIRAHLQERLALQRAALREYERVLAKWGNESSPERIGIAASVQRDHDEKIANNADAGAVGSLIAEAFDSQEFADQAAMTILVQTEVKRSPKVALANPVVIGKFTSEMRKTIAALQAQLGLPGLKVRPEPPIPPKEFSRELKRGHITTQGLRAGFTPERIEELLEKVQLGPKRAKIEKAESKPEADEADSG